MNRQEQYDEVIAHLQKALDAMKEFDVGEIFQSQVDDLIDTLERYKKLAGTRWETE